MSIGRLALLSYWCYYRKSCLRSSCAIGINLENCLEYNRLDKLESVKKRSFNFELDTKLLKIVHVKDFTRKWNLLYFFFKNRQTNKKLNKIEIWKIDKNVLAFYEQKVGFIIFFLLVIYNIFFPGKPCRQGINHTYNHLKFITINEFSSTFNLFT